jgi:hypothetical protein
VPSGARVEPQCVAFQTCHGGFKVAVFDMRTIQLVAWLRVLHCREGLKSCQLESKITAAPNISAHFRKNKNYKGYFFTIKAYN